MGNKEKLEKAKVNMDYEEKLEKAMELYPTANADQRYVLECLFPELKESEDERIRKSIISGLKYLETELGWDAVGDVDILDAYAWLEKQGEQKVTTVDFNAKDWCVSKVDGKIHNICHSVNKAEGNDVVKCLINGMKFYYEDNEEATWGTEKFSMKVKDILSWLEKQGGIDNCPLEGSTKTVMTDSKKNQVEPKFKVGDIIKFKTKDGYSEPWQIIQVDMLDKKYRLKDGYVLHFSEEDAYELVEQKAADKVEPKFKVGEWVILTAGATLQIVKVDTNKRLYWFNDNSYLPIVNEECLYHWTVQDAKNGDVLVTKEDGRPFIFNGLLDKSHPESPVAYCGIDDDDNFFVSISGDKWWTGKEVCPSTKEQRDLLFQKMNDAGYEWDADKKKLKKKSQRMISAEAKEALYNKPAWKPSDEQMDALETAVSSLQSTALETLYDNLKRL